ncbi:MAG: hypothetical protein ACI4VQ_05325 [Clostridia bacterium]
MKEIINKIKNKIENLNYFIIIIASIIICIPLLNKNLNVYIDDGIQHICRLIGTYQTIEEGQFLPMIMSNFCNNFGYSWNIFYSPLTAYAPLIFKVLGFSFVNSLKLFMFAITLLSGIAMYKFVLKVTKNNKISILAAVLYILAPYRITDMYIRTAIAELASFIFIPIIFNGLYTIINEEKKSYLLAFGVIGLILTHTVITLYTAILCFIYLLVFIKKLKNKNVIKYLFINLLLALLVTSFYWVGLAEHYLDTDYEVFIPGRMQRLDVLEYYKVEFWQLFFTSNEQTMVYAIGLCSVIGLILTPVAYKKIPVEYKKIYNIFLILGLVLVFMTLTIFPFEKLPNMLTMIQFTFRLFEFTTFFFSFIVAINYGLIIKKFAIKDILILTLILALLLAPYISKIDFNIKYDEKNLLEPVKITENTGRVHAGMASMEYLPGKAFNNLEYLINREDKPIIINSEGNNIQIDYYKKDGSNMVCKLSNIEAETIIELPYIYYLGYRIEVNGIKVDYTESDNGFIQIETNEQMIDKGNITINVRYLGTFAMLVATGISVISVIVLLVLQIKKNMV